MGSFNTTCFASNQTIASGDKCLVFAIKQSRSYKASTVLHRQGTSDLFGVANSTCHSTCFWSPESPMLEAKYDDYGRVELEDTPANRSKLFSMICEWRNLPVTEQGESKYHDAPIDVQGEIEKLPKLKLFFDGVANSARVDFSFSQKLRDEAWQEMLTVFNHVWQGAQNHRAFVEDGRDPPAPLQFAIMSERAAEALVQMAAANKSYRGHTYEPKIYFQEAFKQEIPAELKSLLTEDASRARYFSARQAIESIERIFGGDGRNRWGNYQIYVAIDNLVRDVVDEKLTTDQAFELVWPFWRGAYIMNSLEAMNVKITPMVYSGQDYNNDQGRTYAKFIAEVSAQITKDRKEYYGEDEEED